MTHDNAFERGKHLARAPAQSCDAECAPVLEQIANKAREWAGHYKPHSDGRNTFVLFAEWVESLTAPPAPVGAQEALAPFAKLADAADHFGKDDDAKACLFVFPGDGEIDVGVTFGDCRKARAILATLSQPRATDGAVRVLPKRPDSIYSQFHLDNWSDWDFAKHAAATRKTLAYLIDLEAALAPNPAAGSAGAEEIDDGSYSDDPRLATPLPSADGATP